MKKNTIARSGWPLFVNAFVILLVVAGVLGWRLYHLLESEVVTRFSAHRWEVPSKIYAEPLLLYPGVDIADVDLFTRLARVEYRAVDRNVQASGEYFPDPQKRFIQIFLHEFPYLDRDPRIQKVNIVLQNGKIQRLVDKDVGTELSFLEIEPEVLTGLYDDMWGERRIVKLYDVPSLLVKAILAAEDQRFFEHEGIDPWRIVGAGWANLTAGRAVQGGSTLTQQLVKNFFLTQEKTIKRKLVEVCIAVIIESHYSKLEILENYLNEIYLGQRNARGIFGVWEASRYYFGKEPRDLTASEVALLAGLVKAPNRYTPTRHPERALIRRNYVLQRMHEIGSLNEAEYKAALAEKISLREMPAESKPAPYFADFVQKELEQRYTPEVLTTGGLYVFTSLDLRLQRIAEKAVRTGLEKLEAKYSRLRREKPEERLQACLVAIQPQTGEIRAMVGGRDYQTSQFNRAAQAHRQPGSIFKPVVYLAALMAKRELGGRRFLPTSPLQDAPFTWVFGVERWKPQNYNRRYRGSVPLHRALELSLNAATAHLARSIGLRSIRQTAQQLGFVSHLPLYPSLSLGAAEVTPFEVASAYSTMANEGLRATSLPIKRIVTHTGETLERHAVQIEQVFPPEEIHLLTHMLEGVLKSGTARGARGMGFDRPAAGKTGTTNDYGDAWFIGYTPDLLAVVWVGFDQRQSLRLTGSQAALPIWIDFMKQVTAGRPVIDFPKPPRVSFVELDPLSGLLATPYCPSLTTQAFYNGQEPTKLCPLHDAYTWPVDTFPPSSSPMPIFRGHAAEQPPPPSDAAPASPAEEKKPWWRLF